MSESGNPARYMGSKTHRPAEGMALDLEGEPIPLEELPKDETPIIAYVLFRGSINIHPDAQALPIEPLGWEPFGGCIADEMDWGEGDCQQQVVAIVNGWSAGPCSFCQQHLDRLVDEMGDEGLQWKPVRTTGQQVREWLVQPGCGPLFMHWPELEGKDPRTI